MVMENTDLLNYCLYLSNYAYRLFYQLLRSGFTEVVYKKIIIFSKAPYLYKIL